MFSKSVLSFLFFLPDADQLCRLCWYVADKYLRDIKAKEEFSSRVFEGIEALACFLVSEVRTAEKGTDQAKKEAKEQIPADRVKDAAALARELRWRVRIAAGYGSDDEGLVRKDVKVVPLVNGAAGTKRKRGQVEQGEDRMAKFKNFKPRLWETVSEVASENDKRVVRASKPDRDQWTEHWVDWKDDATEGTGADEADVNRRRDVIVKVRRTATGVERQRVERVIEEWRWSEASPTLSPGGSGDEKTKMEVDLPEDTGARLEDGHPPAMMLVGA
jgi:hypothetical protein